MRSNGHDYLMGDSVKYNKDLKLYVDLPPLSSKTFEVKLFKNGQEMKASRIKNTVWEIEGPGFYRVYARLRIQFPIPGELRWIPWIYTNNFYVQ
jgi:hypothetical protein